jgi:hypothetical protein
VDIPRKYPAVLGAGPPRFRANEFVEARYRGLAVDSDVIFARSRPWNSQVIKCGAEQFANVRTLISRPRAWLGSLAGSVGLALFSAVSPSHGRSRNCSCRLRQGRLPRFRSPLWTAILAPLGAIEPKVGEAADRFVGELRGTLVGFAGVMERQTCRL